MSVRNTKELVKLSKNEIEDLYDISAVNAHFGWVAECNAKACHAFEAERSRGRFLRVRGG